MKKLSKTLLLLIVVFTFYNCSDDATDVTEETTEIQSKNGEYPESIMEILGDMEEYRLYRISPDYVEENSYLLEEDFMSVEAIDVVRYNDVHFFKVSGQNYEAVDTIEYYALDEIVGTGTELSSGGNGGSYCNGCIGSNRTRIDYYYMRPDGTFYLRNWVCFPCPPGLQSAISAANINSSHD